MKKGTRVNGGVGVVLAVTFAIVATVIGAACTLHTHETFIMIPEADAGPGSWQACRP